MKHLDIKTWLYGLLAAVVGGGAGSVSATITAAVIKPDAFNLGVQLKDTLILMGVTFVMNGALNMFFYLKQSPLPPVVDEKDL